MSANRPHNTISGSRRKFLANAAAAAATGAAMAAGTQARAAAREQRAASAANVDFDVVVIGGGFSGAAAARDCRKYGLRTLLLEARNRLAGRTFDTHWNGHHIEMGGTWVHWVQPYTWSEIQRYGLDVIQTPGAVPERIIIKDDDVYSDTPYAKVSEQLTAAGNAYFSDAKLAWERPWDTHFNWERLVERDPLTTADRLKGLKLSPVQQAALVAVLEACGHCRIEQASYLEIARWYALGGWSWDLMSDSIERYQIKEGTGELVRRMIADGKPEVKLSSPVKRIEQRKDVALVTTEHGETYSAKAVILAVPMNCLANIECSPALSPGKVAASRERHTGAGNKFYVEIRGRQGKAFLLAPVKYGAGFTFTYKELANSTVFVGFGSDPTAFDPNDEDSLQRVMRNFIPDAEVMACTSYSWVQDPFALGTYCSYRPGKLTKWFDELRRPEGRIVMAGSDVSEGWRGFIDGAIARGVRAAHEVAAELVS